MGKLGVIQLNCTDRRGEGSVEYRRIFLGIPVFWLAVFSMVWYGMNSVIWFIFQFVISIKIHLLKTLKVVPLHLVGDTRPLFFLIRDILGVYLTGFFWCISYSSCCIIIASVKAYRWPSLLADQWPISPNLWVCSVEQWRQIYSNILNTWLFFRKSNSSDNSSGRYWRRPSGSVPRRSVGNNLW